MDIAMTDYSVLKMMQVCDSLFPIGAFTQSNGLETFIQKKKIQDEASLEEYVENYIMLMAYNDFMAVRLGYELAYNMEELVVCDCLYTAMKSPREIREGSEKLCSRFIKILVKIGDCPILEQYAKRIEEGKCKGNYALAMGVFMREQGIELEAGLTMFIYSLVSATVVNAVKIIPLSQVVGQKIIHNSFDSMIKAGKLAIEEDTSYFGLNGVGMEIYSMNHETLYSRLYMS